MREIKFRSWCFPTKQMQDWDSWEYDGIRFMKNENFHFMQYTGLKDKNGKEIYEGDILNMTYHGSVYIVKPEIKGVIGFENAAFIVGEDRVPLGRIGRSLEVIGNIYENPELLES